MADDGTAAPAPERSLGTQPTTPAAEGVRQPVSFAEAFRFWLKLGFINFGGPAGQIAIMHRELVDQKRWVPEPPFLRALNFSMLLPGPEATDLEERSGGCTSRAVFRARSFDHCVRHVPVSIVASIVSP